MEWAPGQQNPTSGGRGCPSWRPENSNLGSEFRTSVKVLVPFESDLMVPGRESLKHVFLMMSGIPGPVHAIAPVRFCLCETPRLNPNGCSLLVRVSGDLSGAHVDLMQQCRLQHAHLVDGLSDIGGPFLLQGLEDLLRERAALTVQASATW